MREGPLDGKLNSGGTANMKFVANMKKLFSTVPMQLAVLLLATILLSVLFTLVMTKAYSDWLPADAEITNWQTGRGVSHILYFRYTVRGREYHGQDSFSKNFPQCKIGDIVTAWYDPDDPSRVMLSQTKPDAGLWTYAPFFFAIPAAFFILGGGTKRKNRSFL